MTKNAGTYVKLQQAYAAESNAAGGWTLIGYTAPGTNGVTTNFTYTGAIDANGSTADATVNAWKAAPNVDLNDCASAGRSRLPRVMAARLLSKPRLPNLNLRQALARL